MGTPCGTHPLTMEQEILDRLPESHLLPWGITRLLENDGSTDSRVPRGEREARRLVDEAQGPVQEQANANNMRSDQPRSNPRTW
jgi:hypothetical protein